mmetsp:Transcript_13023/g.28741  ORF Transcript_13023/g.28741 Transcript_13023/m.28741 type:complete len:330 (-) Transcript_13023:421-1410(-)
MLMPSLAPESVSSISAIPYKRVGCQRVFSGHLRKLLQLLPHPWALRIGGSWVCVELRQEGLKHAERRPAIQVCLSRIQVVAAGLHVALQCNCLLHSGIRCLLGHLKVLAGGILLSLLAVAESQLDDAGLNRALGPHPHENEPALHGSVLTDCRRKDCVHLDHGVHAWRKEAEHRLYCGHRQAIYMPTTDQHQGLGLLFEICTIESVHTRVPIGLGDLLARVEWGTVDADKIKGVALECDLHIESYWEKVVGKVIDDYLPQFLIPCNAEVVRSRVLGDLLSQPRVETNADANEGNVQPDLSLRRYHVVQLIALHIAHVSEENQALMPRSF